MTWGELKRKVYALAFENCECNDDIMIQSVNRALTFVASTVRPILKSYTINQTVIENLIKCNTSVQYNGSPLTYSAGNVKAYYFEVKGRGVATVSDGMNTIAIPFDVAEYTPYKGFVSGDTSIAFSGDYVYDIRNVALYKMTLNDTLDGIPPFQTHLKYDIRELTKDGDYYPFFRLAMKNPVKQGYHSRNDYYVVEDYYIEDKSVIVLDRRESGEFEVWYESKPIVVDCDTPDDTDLGLDNDVLELAVLLTAHYTWLDEDPVKADIYYQQYEQIGRTVIASDTERPETPSYKNTTGWW